MPSDDLSKRELVNRWIVAELLAPRGRGPLARRYVVRTRPGVPAFAQPEPKPAEPAPPDEEPSR